MRRVPAGASEIPVDRYRLAAAHVAQMPRASVSNQPWTSIGPGNIGGRTRSFVINPRNLSIMYAGAVSGGVWKSTDGGRNWSVLTDGLSNINIGALALDPADPNVIYAGTGEQYGGGDLAGAGIFKSIDAGASWTQLAATATGTNFRYVNRIAVSPRNSAQIYAATAAGLLASKDGGASWTLAPLNAGYYGCQDLAIRTDMATDYLFAACSGPNLSTTFAVWRNTDAAGTGTWTSVFTAPNMGRTVIALAPSQQSTIYAAAAGSPASPRDGVLLAGVFRSTANGDAGSWTTQVTGSDPSPWNALLFSGIQQSTSAFCSNGGALTPNNGTWGKLLAVDPLDPNKVWVGGVDLFRSDDGGVTWGVASRWDLSTIPQYSHADRHLLVFSPDFDGAGYQTAFQLTDGGIFRTDNARAAVSKGPRAGCNAEYQANSAVTWTHVDNSYAVTQFYHGIAYPGGAAYLAGSQDTGVERGTDSGGVNAWVTLTTGDGGAVAVDPIDINRVLMTTQNLALRRAVDGGTFVNAVAGITEDSTKFPFEAYLAVDPNDPTHLFLGGTTNLWRSVDQAVTWTAAAPVEANGAVSAITVSPRDSNTVMFGTTHGLIYRNPAALASNGGNAWPFAQPRSGNVASIAFDPSNPNTVYATYSTLKSLPTQAHVYRSSDGGATWVPSDGIGSTAVPDTGVWRILVDPRNTSTLYLGTDAGLMISSDGGATWSHDNGLPNVVIEDMSFDQGVTGNWLFAYTFGRGAFRTPLPGAAAAVTGCTYSVSPKTITADETGGLFPVTVTTQPGCSWYAFPGKATPQFTVQSPAAGTGSGTAYVAASPNLVSNTAATETLNIAGTPVTATQAAPLLQNVGNDLVTSATPIAVPSMVRRVMSNLTSSAADPVHSCTGSADFNTVWWSVTPASSGVLLVQGRGDRLDVFGDAGIALTAYAQSVPSTELACATLARNATGRTLIPIKFPVTAGTTYLIEMATTTAGAGNANANLAVSMGTPDVVVTMNPANVTLLAGGSPQTFTAQAINAAGNTAVRWSIAPSFGVISQAGVYTPPAQVAAPVTVTVTASSFADPTKTATARITVNPAGPPPPSSIIVTAAGVVNAATFKTGGVAPGEIVTIFGSGFGPASLAGLSVGADGKVTTSAGGTSVTFDGVAAPMIYAVTGQLSAVVPYSVAGKTSTQLRVSFGKDTSAAVTVPVVAASPGVFTADSSGSGQISMANQDYSLNSSANPAAKGSVVIFYGTGEGQTTPPGVDGQVNNTVFPAPVAAPKVTIGGQNAQIAYFGAAPGFVSGVFQVNVYVPGEAPSGPAVPVTVTVGSTTSPTGTTIAIR